MYSIPFSAAAVASSSLIGRDASEMSVSPVVNRLKPPPVPDTPTFTRTSGCILPNSSATASDTGNTVLDPSISIVRDSPASPQAASSSTAARSPDSSTETFQTVDRFLT